MTVLVSAQSFAPFDYYRVTVTDTFGGEANFAWKRTYGLRIARGCDSQRAIMREAKAVAGYTGVPGCTENIDSDYTFRPRGQSVVMFVEYVPYGFVPE